jgi:hypothetical protein
VRVASTWQVVHFQGLVGDVWVASIWQVVHFQGLVGDVWVVVLWSATSLPQMFQELLKIT